MCIRDRIYYRHIVLGFGLWEPVIVTAVMIFMVSAVLGIFGGMMAAGFYEVFLKKVGASNDKPSLTVFFAEWLFALTAPIFMLAALMYGMYAGGYSGP